MAEPFVWQLVNVFTQQITNIYKRKLTLGRSKNVDMICLSTTASRSHAEFILSEDGSLKVKDLNSLNGTYVNKEKIIAGVLHTLKDGDEVGIGIDLEAAHLHNEKCYVFKVQKMNCLDSINLDDSDGEQNDDEKSHQENIPVEENLQLEDKKDVAHQLSSTMSRNALKETNCSKMEIEQVISSTTEATKSNVKPEMMPFEGEFIVIDDDDDDINLLSQVLETKDVPIKVEPGVTDDIFDNIKKEIEEMDKIECQEWQYPLTIGSDDEDLSEIFAEELKKFNQTEKEPPSPTMVTEDNVNALLENRQSTSTASPTNVIPSKSFYKKSLVLIEPQPLNIQKDKKRKTDTKKNEKSSKKLKTLSNSQLDVLNKTKKNKRKKESSTSVSREEKIKIVQARQGKLKEIATKSPENKSNEIKSIVAKPKVKVSEGRGNFLLNNIEAVPSTSKTKDVAVKKPISSLSKKTSTSQAVIKERKERDVIIDASSELKEVLSWNTNWLTKNELLAYLNPVVRLRKLKPLENYYYSYRDYFEMNHSLLMVELWSHIQKEFELRRSNCVFPMYIEDYEYTNSNICTLNCLAYFTKNQVNTMSLIRENDLIVTDLRVQENGQTVLKPVFGYVQEATKCVLKNHHYINSNLAQKLDAAPDTKILFKLLIHRTEFKPKCINNLKIITSLVSHLRLFKSLRYLEHSPLIKYILKPSVKDFQLPDIAKTALVSKDSLNDLQLTTVMEAVYVCTRRQPGLYLIQGPPGTGKTSIIKNIVLEMLYGKHKIKDSCLLLVAPSNAAVDQLVLKIVNDTRPKLTDEQKKVMKLIRVGPASSIHPAVKSYSLECIVKRNMKYQLLSSSTQATERYNLLQNEIRKLEVEIENFKVRNAKYSDLKTKVKMLKFRSENFARELLKENYNAVYNQNCDKIIYGANIICTTLSSCMGRKIEENVLSGKLKFSCCIVDEATQSNEQETLIPVRLGVQRMVLVGDPQQLPATVMSLDAKLLGYGCSLFQRILRNFETSTVKPFRILNKQYRMHPEICKFPNTEYYDNKLVSAHFEYYKPLHKLSPFLMFSLNMSQSNHKNEEMYRNGNETNFVKKLIDVLINNIPKAVEVSIGVITPYQNQRSAILDMLKTTATRKHITINCNTVDSFQGQEMDIIILSCVREAANTFLSDVHRLNVALTRAKYALFVVGTKTLFDSCAALAKLRESAEQRNLFKDGTRLQQDDLKLILWGKKDRK